MAKRTTTLRIDSDLWRDVKLHCVRENIAVSTYVEKLLLEDLKKKSS